MITPKYFRVYLNINTKNNRNAIEIRTITTVPEDIKYILDAAIIGEPILVYPTFRDRLKALSSLAYRKIIKLDPKKGTYKFLI